MKLLTDRKTDRQTNDG